MNSIAFFAGSIVLFGFAFLLLRGSSPNSECGAAAYERKRIRRVMGMIVSIMAGMALLISLLAFGVLMDWGRL